jgi:ADP-heptose:LPS heptosyltransferase
MITAAAVTRRLEDSVCAEVIIAGGEKDRVAADGIIARAGAGLNACGVFSISETAALLRNCSLAVTVDSGPMHLAAAMGTRTVVIYSRTNPQLHRWLPLGTGHTILFRETPCAGCEHAVCPVSGHPCIDGVTAEEIVSAASARLRGLPVSAARGETQILAL